MGVASDFLKSKLPDSLKVDDKQIVGIGGFDAYVALSLTKTLSSTSPDIVLEDGTTISDTIFLNPVNIEIYGEVADVNLRSNVINDIFRAPNQVIGIIEPFLPGRTVTQINKTRQIVNNANTVLNQVDDLIDRGTQLYNIFGGNDSKPPQEQFLDYLEQVHSSKVLISIETPYRTYDNCRIESFQTTTTNEDLRTYFTLQIKQLRLAQLEFAQVKAFGADASKALGGQASSLIEKGVSGGKPANQSLLSKVLGAL